MVLLLTSINHSMCNCFELEHYYANMFSVSPM